MTSRESKRAWLRLIVFAIEEEHGILPWWSETKIVRSRSLMLVTMTRRVGSLEARGRRVWETGDAVEMQRMQDRDG